MIPADLPGDANPGRIPDDLADAGAFATAADGFDHGLVVLAMGESFWLVPAEAGYRLLVQPKALAAVNEQLACFDHESRGWPPQTPVEQSPPRRLELVTPLLWALVVLAVFWGQITWPGRWEKAGALDSRAVFDGGEWWRLGTALFLHADPGHLISNLLSGIFVFGVVISTIGRWRGWLLLAGAALAGNLAVAALHYPGPYRALGASTAIFAGLGLLTGRAIRVLRLPGRAHPWRAVFVPLAAGLTLLALFGAGGREIDVGAHLTGFAAGMVLGFAAGFRRENSPVGT